MPNLISLLSQKHPVDLAAAIYVEQAEFHALRMLGEDREVNAFAVPRRPEGVGLARPCNGSSLTEQELILTRQKMCDLIVRTIDAITLYQDGCTAVFLIGNCGITLSLDAHTSYE